MKQEKTFKEILDRTANVLWKKGKPTDVLGVTYSSKKNVIYRLDLNNETVGFALPYGYNPQDKDYLLFEYEYKLGVPSAKIYSCKMENKKNYFTEKTPLNAYEPKLLKTLENAALQIVMDNQNVKFSEIENVKEKCLSKELFGYLNKEPWFKLDENTSVQSQKGDIHIWQKGSDTGLLNIIKSNNKHNLYLVKNGNGIWGDELVLVNNLDLGKYFSQNMINSIEKHFGK